MNSYWEKRILNNMAKIYNTQEKKNRELIRGYKQALENIKKDIKEAEVETESRSKVYKLRHFKATQKQVEEELKRLEKLEQEFYQTSLFDSYEKTDGLIAKQLGEVMGISFNKIPKETIEKIITTDWSGATWSERIWKNQTNLSFKVKETIRNGIIKGSSYTQMTRELNKVFKTGEKEARRLIRTETAHIVNEATKNRYNEAGIKRVEVFTAEDERMCSRCGSEHGNRYDINRIILPLHPQCRCCLLPIIE